MSALEKARSAWGEDMPNWVRALAEECDRSSQNKAADRIGRSPSLVSNVLAAKYAGDMAAVEDLVRGILLSETLACPALGEIGKKDCRDWRTKAREFRNVNTLYVQMFRACNRCPRHRDTTTETTSEKEIDQ
ncbi:hypothetical protein [Sagittula salina]|uniref:Transcriptional regulator n=1 Tax=Sagittula salina TaxID=2820268 RepID=A0A940S2D1_9RHOB|nr:hypothetical protein [Sagittula salina]MBP0483966.1 hypothetical protein [Sagittula salina]